MPDIVEDRPLSHGLFIAAFKGEKLPPTVAVFSPDGLDRVRLVTANGPETTALLAFEACSSHYVSLPWYSAIASAPGISSADSKRRSWLPSGHGLVDPITVGWYSEHPATASAGEAETTGAQALHYEIETTVHKNMDVEGRTMLRLRAGPGGVRVIPVDLFSKLRLATITQKGEAGMPIEIPFIQSCEESPDPVLVILPSPLASGEEAELEFAYRGNGVIQDDYEGMHILAPGDWYPVLNAARDWAIYDLTYRIPRKRGIVSVGKFVGSSDDGEFKIYHFATGSPVRGAAFNYGDFLNIERDDQVSGVRIGVSISRTSPYHLWATSQDDIRRVAWDVLADSINTARVGTAYFGPLVQNDIAVSEQPQWGFGQSWPTLIYIPAIAFVESFLRVDPWRKEIIPRAFAQQWWGNSIGSATYRDAWLEDGLTEFTVGLVLENALGAKEFRDYWKRVRKDILDNGEIGPISLGRRLTSQKTPDAYKTIVRYKGAFVVQMLRNLFRDERSANPDQRFIGMMKDFATTWAGRNPTTADFRAIVERHAPPALAGDMGWFFRQWIEGTAIPEIKAAIRIEEGANGHYLLTGEITQSEVPGDFRSILPVYLELEKGRFERSAQVSIIGNSTLIVRQEIPLPKKPLGVIVNPNHEWLTR